MERILATQRNNAQKITGRTFLLGIAGIVLRLAIAQILCNLLIAKSGIGLFNLLFYGYAIFTLVSYMGRTVANYGYTLGSESLILEKRLGDSTTSVVTVPLSKVIAVRPVLAGERLKIRYSQVTVIDASAKPSFRIRAAFVLSILWARAARRVAGKGVSELCGYAIVYEEDKQKRACVFKPNKEMRRALEACLGDRYGKDDRASGEEPETLSARSLQRAFPELYPYVKPLVSKEEMAWAEETVLHHKLLKQLKKEQKERKKRADSASQKVRKQSVKRQKNEPAGSFAETQNQAHRRRRQE